MLAVKLGIARSRGAEKSDSTRDRAAHYLAGLTDLATASGLGELLRKVTTHGWPGLEQRP